MNAYEQGQEAYICGISQGDNPYNPETENDNFIKWDNGYVVSALGEIFNDILNSVYNR